MHTRPQLCDPLHAAFRQRVVRNLPQLPPQHQLPRGGVCEAPAAGERERRARAAQVGVQPRLVQQRGQELVHQRRRIQVDAQPGEGRGNAGGGRGQGSLSLGVGPTVGRAFACDYGNSQTIGPSDENNWWVIAGGFNWVLNQVRGRHKC